MGNIAQKKEDAKMRNAPVRGKRANDPKKEKEMHAKKIVNCRVLYLVHVVEQQFGLARRERRHLGERRGLELQRLAHRAVHVVELAVPLQDGPLLKGAPLVLVDHVALVQNVVAHRAERRHADGGHLDVLGQLLLLRGGFDGHRVDLVDGEKVDQHGRFGHLGDGDALFL